MILTILKYKIQKASQDISKDHLCFHAFQWLFFSSHLKRKRNYKSCFTHSFIKFVDKVKLILLWTNTVNHFFLNTSCFQKTQYLLLLLIYLFNSILFIYFFWTVRSEWNIPFTHSVWQNYI